MLNVLWHDSSEQNTAFSPTPMEMWLVCAKDKTSEAPQETAAVIKVPLLFQQSNTFLVIVTHFKQKRIVCTVTPTSRNVHLAIF